MEARGLAYTCHVTQFPGQASEFSADEAGREGPVRIYSVGGDGTLREVAAGAIGRENAEVGAFPCGTGNDYIKTFGREEDFLSPEKQLAARSRTVDTIRSDSGVSVNLCTVGMDARVSMLVSRIKRIPFLSGPVAYDLAMIRTLFGKIGENLKIVIDSIRSYRDVFLMAIACNGRYYGGGFCPAPTAAPDDGLLDFVLIRKPPFWKIPKLAQMYKAGRHLGAREFDGILTFCRGKKMEISAARPVAENIDGDCRYVGKEKFSVLPSSLRFLVPKSGAGTPACGQL
jgi:diacylglycerol kinase family enzyme